MKLGRLDRAIIAIAPSWGRKRVENRVRVQALSGAYEAVEQSRLRRQSRDYGSGNTAIAGSAVRLRNMARNLDRNHDLARGVLNVMVRNIIGADGIGVEPQPLNPDGTINIDLQKQLAELHREWRKQPEVTGEYNWARSEQLLCRTWLRDGEGFFQYLEGNVQYLQHGTRVPLSLELLEPDFVPSTLDDPGNNVLQGVQCNAWGKPTNYYVYLTHPGEMFMGSSLRMKVVPTERMGHIKYVDRIGQRRGVSMFASVLGRLDDIKDYEESERIAAKVAASMTAFIKKGTSDDWTNPNESGTQRLLEMQPGMVFDDLKPGEDIGTIDSNRPNPNAVTWRDGQLRAVSAGTEANFSSISRNYRGSYSSQRQELVEGWEAYALLSAHFIDQVSREVYERFVAACVLAGLVRVPRGMTFQQLSHAMYVAPQMPWIDPKKEAEAFAALEDRCYISGPQVIRRMRRNPDDTLRDEKRWQEQLRESGVVTSTLNPPQNSATVAGGSTAPGAPAASSRPAANNGATHA